MCSIKHSAQSTSFYALQRHTMLQLTKTDLYGHTLRVDTLTLTSTAVSICTTCFNIIRSVFRQFICVFRTILRTNRECFSKRHQPVGVHSEDSVCFPWGRNLIFQYYLQESYVPWRKIYRYRKFHPTTSHEGIEEDRYSTTLSLTFDLDVGEGWSRRRRGHFTPGKETRFLW